MSRKYDFDNTPDHRCNASFRWGVEGFPEDVIGMGTADLDYRCAPCIREALIPIAEDNCYNYRQKTDRYYAALTGWYERNYGLKVEKEWLSNTPGTIGAVKMALEILSSTGDAVIAQTPLFGPLKRAVEGAGCTLIENSMKTVNGHYEIDFEDFEAKLEKHKPAVFLLVNPHNPTGRVFTRSELERLVSLCYSHGVKIISDEVHSLVLYGSSRHIPLLAVSDEAKEIGIQVVSLSKGYNIMSLPHAIITIANPDIREEWNKQIIANSYGYAVNSFAIAAVTEILEGHADEWMKELTEYLDDNLRTILKFIYEHNLPLKPYVPEGGFLLWIDCREAGLGEEKLDEVFMERTHIVLDDGEKEFGPAGKGFIRINYAVTGNRLKEALERIESLFTK